MTEKLGVNEKEPAFGQKTPPPTTTIHSPGRVQLCSFPVHRRPTHTSRKVSRLASQMMVRPASSRRTWAPGGADSSTHPITAHTAGLMGLTSTCSLVVSNVFQLNRMTVVHASRIYSYTCYNPFRGLRR